MSFTKSALDQIFDPIEKIRIQTINDNDLTQILEALNCIITIQEYHSKNDQDLEFLWNEIVSDAISVIYSATSGNYRLAISGLRSILELSCHSFYYHDHKLELKLFINEDHKADRYVSFLIANYSFFTTIYIKTFFPAITTIQTHDNSISSLLNTTYSKLCDVVHGRYKSLTKIQSLKIEYSKEMFQKFKTIYIDTISAVCCMHYLRFQITSDNEIKKFVSRTNTLNL